MNDHAAPVVRRLARIAATAPAILVLLACGPAVADVPEGPGWEDPEPVSVLYSLVLLGGVPLLLIAVITLLVYVPSMARGEKYQPGLAWRNENVWFGGPNGGIENVDQQDRAAIQASGADDCAGEPEESRGGASVRW